MKLNQTMMRTNKEDITKFVKRLYEQGERIIDILLEVQRRYGLDIQELPKLLDKKMKAKLTQQEAKLGNIKE